MNDIKTIYVCSNIGVSGTTPCFVKQTDDGKYEVRMGFSLMGSTNMTDDEFTACGHNPFHPNFRDNYVSGVGWTEDSAVEKMKEDLNNISGALWA